jgi:hypothetical protein
MIDYVKLSTRVRDVAAYKEKSRLSFTQEVDTRTGEVIRPVSIAEVDNMEFHLYDSGYYLIKGSIHKFHNGGLYNHNDFNLRDFYSAVQDLSSLLQVDLWQCRLDALEVGVNITPVVSTTEFLANTYMHGRKPFKNVSLGERGDYRQAAYQDYWVKIYDKGAQYNLPNQLMRFELKFRSDELRRKSLKYVSDLKQMEVIDRLGELLAMKFDQNVFIEPSLSEDILPLKLREKILPMKNPRYWYDLAANPSSKNIYRQRVDMLSKLQSDLTENVKAQTLQRIKCKWADLIQEKHHLGEEKGKFSTSVIDLKIPRKRSCLVTGLDISMQKDESQFLFTTGVKYYRNHQPGIYADLECRLSHKWDNASEDVRCREIAHSIRNEYHNRRRNLIAQQSAHRNYPSLFGNSSFEDPNLIDRYGLAFNNR